MSDSDDDGVFRLNSLHRFEKHSKLVLESHSHCEVPAGCGGVVLQWVNPAVTAACRVEVASSGDVDAFLDGRPLPSSRFELAFGPHLLALSLTAAKAPRYLLAGVALAARGDDEAVPLAGGLSADDGTWLSTGVDPGDGWLEPGFDDSRWSTLSAAALTAERVPEVERYPFEQLFGTGAQPLAIGERAWIRKRFTVPRPATTPAKESS